MQKSTDSLTDNELVARSQKGDASAFGDLYERHMPLIYRYVFYRVSSQQEAEDITEAVFLRALQALPRYHPGRAGFAAWLYRIARNAVIDHYRTSKQHANLDDVVSALSANDDSGLEMEEVTILRQALASLPREQQEVLLMRFVEGLSHEEVSAILDKSPGACRMIQHRALKALGQELDGEQE